MCQYAADLDRWFVLGRTSELTWTVNSDSPLNFTIQYRDGEVGPDMTTPPLNYTLIECVVQEDNGDICALRVE